MDAAALFSKIMQHKLNSFYDYYYMVKVLWFMVVRGPKVESFEVRPTQVFCSVGWQCVL